MEFKEGEGVWMIEEKDLGELDDYLSGKEIVYAENKEGVFLIYYSVGGGMLQPRGFASYMFEKLPKTAKKCREGGFDV